MPTIVQLGIVPLFSINLIFLGAVSYILRLRTGMDLINCEAELHGWVSLSKIRSYVVVDRQETIVRVNQHEYPSDILQDQLAFVVQVAETLEKASGELLGIDFNSLNHFNIERNIKALRIISPCGAKILGPETRTSEMLSTFMRTRGSARLWG